MEKCCQCSAIRTSLAKINLPLQNNTLILKEILPFSVLGTAGGLQGTAVQKVKENMYDTHFFVESKERLAISYWEYRKVGANSVIICV